MTWFRTIMMNMNSMSDSHLYKYYAGDFMGKVLRTLDLFYGSFAILLFIFNKLKVFMK